MSARSGGTRPRLSVARVSEVLLALGAVTIATSLAGCGDDAEGRMIRARVSPAIGEAAWGPAQAILPFTDRRAFALPSPHAPGRGEGLLLLGGPLALYAAPGDWVVAPRELRPRELALSGSRFRFARPGGFVLVGDVQAASFGFDAPDAPRRQDLWTAPVRAAAVVETDGRARLLAADGGAVRAFDVTDLSDVRPAGVSAPLPPEAVALRRLRSPPRDLLATLEPGLVRIWAPDGDVFRVAATRVVAGEVRGLRNADFDADGADELVVVTSLAITILKLEPGGRVVDSSSAPDAFDVQALEVLSEPAGPGRLVWSTPTELRIAPVSADRSVDASTPLLRRSGIASIAAGDYDGDQDVDLVFTDPLGVHVVERTN